MPRRQPNTTDEVALIAACPAAPGDHAPWLVYSDWLAKYGPPGAEAVLRALLPGILRPGGPAARLAVVHRRRDPSALVRHDRGRGRGRAGLGHATGDHAARPRAVRLREPGPGRVAAVRGVCPVTIQGSVKYGRET